MLKIENSESILVKLICLDLLLSEGENFREIIIKYVSFVSRTGNVYKITNK